MRDVCACKSPQSILFYPVFFSFLFHFFLYMTLFLLLKDQLQESCYLSLPRPAGCARAIATVARVRA